MIYSEPRHTKDLDIVVGTHLSDLEGVRQALEEFGFPMSDQAHGELAQPNRMVSIGRPPARIDILNSITGVDFDEAWEARHDVDVGGNFVPFISKAHLIQAKQATRRPQDLIDLDLLLSEG